MTNIEGNHPPSVSLRDFIDERFRSIDKAFAQHQREHEQHDKAHQREHEDSQKAIDAADRLVAENKKDANEWRDAMDDREKTLATKTDIANLSAAISKLETAETKRSEREGLRAIAEAEDKVEEKDRQNSAQWRIAMVVTTAAVIGSVLVNLVISLWGEAPATVPLPMPT